MPERIEIGTWNPDFCGTSRSRRTNPHVRFIYMMQHNLFSKILGVNVTLSNLLAQFSFFRVRSQNLENNKRIILKNMGKQSRLYLELG